MKISTLQGTAGSLKKPLSWKEMKQIAQEDRQEIKGYDHDYDKIPEITRREP